MRVIPETKVAAPEMKAIPETKKTPEMRKIPALRKALKEKMKTLRTEATSRRHRRRLILEAVKLYV